MARREVFGEAKGDGLLLDKDECGNGAMEKEVSVSSAMGALWPLQRPWEMGKQKAPRKREKAVIRDGNISRRNPLLLQCQTLAFSEWVAWGKGPSSNAF